MAEPLALSWAGAGSVGGKMGGCAAPLSLPCGAASL